MERDVVSELSHDLFVRIQHKTLVDAGSTWGNLATPVSYLRMGYGRPASTDTFARLIRHVKEMPSSTSSTVLYLPLRLKPGDIDPLELQDSRKSFLDQCAERRVEVVFEEPLADWYLFWQVSADFRRRMKEKKMQM